MSDEEEYEEEYEDFEVDPVDLNSGQLEHLRFLRSKMKPIQKKETKPYHAPLSGFYRPGSPTRPYHYPEEDRMTSIFVHLDPEEVVTEDERIILDDETGEEIFIGNGIMDRALFLRHMLEISRIHYSREIPVNVVNELIYEPERHGSSPSPALIEFRAVNRQLVDIKDNAVAAIHDNMPYVDQTIIEEEPVSFSQEDHQWLMNITTDASAPSDHILADGSDGTRNVVSIHRQPKAKLKQTLSIKGRRFTLRRAS